ncbi:MAG: phosphoglucomutase/phosphomannomutase family protein, partial [Chloroflexi bacterium]|nr:phosphoglucomutase/phosphomannomutase family protein [Chloroflexota bacterium]
LQSSVGPFLYDRIDKHVRPFSKKELVRQLKDAAPAELAGLPVTRINDRDGVKYLLGDDSWLLIRPSGTEPVLRIYAEARSDETVQQLLQQGVQLAEQFIPQSE